MPLPDPNAEPAIRDPKKLRNTALMLLAMMVLGGTLILIYYGRVARETARQADKEFSLEMKDSGAVVDPSLGAHPLPTDGSTPTGTENRPAVIYRITPERDLRMLLQDGSTVDLVDLRNHVVVINVISTSNPEPAAASMEVMKRIASARAGTPDVRLMTLLVDPQPREKLEEVLSTTAKANGMTLPQWWMGSNEPKTLHKFIKNELKAEIYPHESGGKWEYDSSIVVIDRNGHIRRAVVPQKQGGPPYVAPFNFEQAAAWDAKGVKTGVNRSNVGQLEFLLNSTIDKLLTEEFKN